MPDQLLTAFPQEAQAELPTLQAARATVSVLAVWELVPQAVELVPNRQAEAHFPRRSWMKFSSMTRKEGFLTLI